MRAVGFKLERERWKPDNKVGYWLWSWQTPVPVRGGDQQVGMKGDAGGGKSTRELHRKVILRDGPGYNNFAICL
jgi:hypothetical protein